MTNLHGSLVLNKGDKPNTNKEISDKLSKQWKTAAPWKLISFGKGFFEFSFASVADMRLVWAIGTVILKPRFLCLSQWTKGLKKHTEHQTHAQVWVRLMELPQEYWLECTLLEIAGAIGTPLLIDSTTQKRIFGHYACVLVDIDFSRRLFHEIMVERDGFAFPMEVVYEWIPYFFSHYQIIRHHVSNYRWVHPAQPATLEKEKQIEKF